MQGPALCFFHRGPQPGPLPGDAAPPVRPGAIHTPGAARVLVLRNARSGHGRQPLAAWGRLAQDPPLGPLGGLEPMGRGGTPGDPVQGPDRADGRAARHSSPSKPPGGHPLSDGDAGSGVLGRRLESARPARSSGVGHRRWARRDPPFWQTAIFFGHFQRILVGPEGPMAKPDTATAAAEA